MPFWVELHREWVLCAICNSSFKSGGDGKWLPQSQIQHFCHYWMGKEVRRGLTLSHLCSSCQHTFYLLAIPSVPGGRGSGQDPAIPSVPRGGEQAQRKPAGVSPLVSASTLPCCCLSLLPGPFLLAPSNKCALPGRGFLRGWREKSNLGGCGTVLQKYVPGDAAQKN